MTDEKLPSDFHGEELAPITKPNPLQFIEDIGESYASGVAKGMDVQILKDKVVAVQKEIDKDKKKEKEGKRMKWYEWILPGVYIVWFIGLYVNITLMLLDKVSLTFLLWWAAAPWLALAAFLPAMIGFIFVVVFVALLIEIPLKKLGIWKEKDGVESD